MTERTLKISDQQIDFIRLILRSPDRGDGWRSVGKMLETTVMRQKDANPELFEIATEDDKMSIRLTERALVLADYI
jgi:hypothetical protein